MSTFLNGFDIAEAASLNTSKSQLGDLVKQYLSDEAIVAKMDGIISRGSKKLDTQVEMVMTAKEDMAALRPYPLQDIHDSIQRRLNTMSRTLAKRYGHNEYRRLQCGRVKKSAFALEHQTAN